MKSQWVRKQNTKYKVVLQKRNLVFRDTKRRSKLTLDSDYILSIQEWNMNFRNRKRECHILQDLIEKRLELGRFCKPQSPIEVQNDRNENYLNADW